MTEWIRWCCYRVVLIAGCCLVAPSQISQAGLQGTVKDNSGAVVPGATVVLKNKNTSDSRTVTSGQSGEYVIPNLNPGEYSVTVSLQGFKTSSISSLTLHTGEQATVDISLELGATTQEVTVQAVVPMLSTASS